MLSKWYGAVLVAAGMLVSTDLFGAGVQGCPPGQKIKGDLVQLAGTEINVRYGPGKDFDRIPGPDGTPFMADRTMQARPLCRVDDWVLAEVIAAGDGRRQAGWLLARFVDSAPATTSTTPPGAAAAPEVRPVAQRCSVEATSSGPELSPQGGRINVRSAPGTTAARVPGADAGQALQLGTEARVRVLCTENGWSFVRVAGATPVQEGWVQADLLGPATPPPATTAAAVKGCSSTGQPSPRIVATDQVNVRVGPGRDYGRIMGPSGLLLLEAGQEVAIQCGEGDWVRVSLPDIPAEGGWVLAEYLNDPAARPLAEETIASAPETEPAAEPAAPLSVVAPKLEQPEPAASERSVVEPDPVPVTVAEAQPTAPVASTPPAPAPAVGATHAKAPVNDPVVVEAIASVAAAEPAAVDVALPPGPCGSGGAPEPYLVGAMGSVLETILMVTCKDKPGPGWFVLESEWRKGFVTPSAATAPITEAVAMCEAKAKENSGKGTEIDFWGEKDLWVTVFPDHKMRVTKSFKVLSGKAAPVTRKISCLIAREQVVEQQTVMLQ